MPAPRWKRSRLRREYREPRWGSAHSHLRRVLAVLGVLPPALLGVYLATGAWSYLLYRADKSAARRNRSRTPENKLHLADLLGGWPGALIAQQQFHHKTMKQPFQFVFWVSVVLNLAACVWLVRSGVAVALTRSLIGQ